MLPRLSCPAAALALACCCLSPPRAPAWGPEGHVVVAKVAELNLKPAARKAVGKMLGTIPISDRRIATFADFVAHNPDHPEYSGSAPWHYVNIPVGKTFNRGRDGNGGANVIDKIEQFKKTLADKDARAEDRLEALIFLVHLVGDLHQPLHCADRDDRGGTRLYVQFLGHDDHHLSLHGAWDSELVRAGMGGLELGDHAFRLDGAITKEQRAAWQKGTVEDWANESNAVAEKAAYRDADDNMLPRKGTPNLDRAYVDRGAGVVKQQLQKGGVRLAKVLNDALAPE